jgi:hypothetical protein
MLENFDCDYRATRKYAKLDGLIGVQLSTLRSLSIVNLKLLLQDVVHPHNLCSFHITNV